MESLDFENPRDLIDDYLIEMKNNENNTMDITCKKKSFSFPI